MAVKIMKGGSDVAEGADPAQLRLEASPRWPGINSVECYYFPRIKLTNRVVWEVMAGTALGKFLDHSEIWTSQENGVVGLRYVHGRAEVMKGRPTISTVLLVKPEPTPDDRWLTYLPAIYEEFMRGYGNGPKTA